MKRWLFAAVLAAGCSTPIGRTVYNPAPSQTARVRADVREVSRGARGGVIQFNIVNLAPEFLEWASGSHAVLRTDKGVVLRSLGLRQFEECVDRHGPIAMGFDDFVERSAPMLDPIGARVNLRTNEEAIIYLAFEAGADVDRLIVDLAPVFMWRSAAGATVEDPTSLAFSVVLPVVPTSRAPSRDALRNVHFGVSVSSNGF